MGIKRFDLIHDAERRDSWMEECYGGKYALFSDYDALAAAYDQARAFNDRASARIRELEAALHKAFNQFENITVAKDLQTAHDRAHEFIGWAYRELPGYQLETILVTCTRQRR